jgi:protein required for attachment to host cells
MKISGKMSDKETAELVKKADVVNTHKIPRIWVVIADAHTAKIYKRDTHGIEMIAGMQPTFQHSADKADKSEPYTHDTHSPAMEFAFEIGLWLEEALKSNSYDRLVLVAAPRMLGDLRKTMSTNVHSHIVAEVNKDLTKMPERELQDELEKIVWF